MHAAVKAFMETNVASYLRLVELDMAGLRQLCDDSDAEDSQVEGGSFSCWCRPGESFYQLWALVVAGSLLSVSSFAGWFSVFPSPVFAISWLCFLSGFFFVVCVFTLQRRVGMLSGI
ncbi:unnamed protein product [Lactuca virosa]|uniref:Vesicle transport protein n=1 Tax=Lactuca virosa TaxID=75947 RepID=A0AAU9MSJ7_9ASTR|nr:unnamed protein product [Lactuca virosa]